MSIPKTKREPVAKTSAAMSGEQLARLKEIFPECLSEGRVDLDKLRQTLGEEIDSRPERYSFTWAGKRDAIRLLQTPSRATLIPCPKESVNSEETSNLFIEGDNLEVLKLLYRSYFGRVKMIYIDPPYNTGNDFVYPDNFADPLDTYLRLTGQKESNGNLLTSNPETSGRYHSAWLSMMYPRLFLARQFLTEDGVIFVSIDDHEFHNLRCLMNEVFGEESFLASFIWHRRQMADSRNLDRASTDHEYVLAYRNPRAVLQGRDIDQSKFSNPDNDPRGPWFSADLTGLATKEQRPNLHYIVTDPATGRMYPPSVTRGWSISQEKFQRFIREDRVLWPVKVDGRPRLKKFLNEATTLKTGFSSILKVGFTTEGTREIQELLGEKLIQFPKPVSLIRAFVEQATAESDIVFDFFAGSGTTAQAVIEANKRDGGKRSFILVQLQEPTGRTDYATIADIATERIRRFIKKESDKGRLHKPDLGVKVFKLHESNYKPWTGVEEKDSDSYGKTMGLYADPLVPGWEPEKVIWEVVVKEGFDLNSRIEKVSEIKGNTVHQVSDSERRQSFRICLDDVLKSATIKALTLSKDDLFICRDKALDDEAAANLALQCRLKTI